MKIFIKEISKHYKTNENMKQTNRQNREVRESMKKPCSGKSVTTPPPLHPLLTKKVGYLRPKTGFQRHIL